MPRYPRKPKTLVRIQREQLEISQGDFARKANVHRTQLSAIENGEKAGPKLRGRIAEALGTTEAQLFHVNPGNLWKAAFPVFEHEVPASA